MKACIYIGTNNLEWCRKYFPTIPPGELPIAGKEWCAYLLDVCSMLGCIDKLYIIDCYPAERLSTLAQRSGYWSTNLTYLHGQPCASPAQLLRKYPEIVDNTKEGLMLFWGLPLPKPVTPEDILLGLRWTDSMNTKLPPGVFLWKNGSFHECLCPQYAIKNIQTYFDLNFTLLDSPDIYTLPGYTDQKDQGLGRNVTILPNCTLKPPMIIQDNCYLGRSITLADGAILGRNTSIEDYTTVRHSIILSNTHIGRRMYLENKIVCGNRVIDPISGAYVDLQEKFLAEGIRTHAFDHYKIVGALVALVLIIPLLPAYLLARLFQQRMDKVPFFHLTMRVYPQLWKVLAFQANLVRFGTDDPHYAFRFSDRYLLWRDEATRKQGDAYYQHHRTILLMLGVVYSSLLRRLFQLSEPPEEGNHSDTPPPEDGAASSETPK